MGALAVVVGVWRSRPQTGIVIGFLHEISL